LSDEYVVWGSVAGEESREYVVRLLARRARNALARARRDLEVGDYDGAVFDAEQAVQLYLKSVILEYADIVPRSHNLRKLLYIVGKLLDLSNEVEEFIERNKYKFHVLEDAYYSARYLPKEFTREDAEELIAFAEEVIEFVESRKASRAPREEGG